MSAIPRKRTSESRTAMSDMSQIADSCAAAIYRLSPRGLLRVFGCVWLPGKTWSRLEGTLSRRLCPRSLWRRPACRECAGPKLQRVQGEVAVAIAGAESPSETQTLGSYSDWRLINR